MKNHKNYLVVISAPSGAGKTTLCKMLLRDFPKLTLSISSTTRAPRGMEKHSVDYFFLEKEEFEKNIRDGKFAEWAQVHGNYYGTSKEVIERSFKAGHSVLLDIDVQGAAQLRKSFPVECYSIFISPPSLEVLEARLKSRGTDPEETIQKRMANAKLEMAEAPNFNKTVINDTLDHAYEELRYLLEKTLQLEYRPQTEEDRS